MRLYLVDKLVCPRCGHFPLTVEIAQEEEGEVGVPDIRPCASYCAHEGKPTADLEADPPCSQCLKRQVQSGEIVCKECASRYLIREGIPNLLINEVVSDWVAEEQAWWDRRYSKIAKGVDPTQLNSSAGEHEVPGNRRYERNKYLFDAVRERGLRGKFVLEIGAGTSQYVAGMLPPAREHFFYVGTDVAKEALRIGSTLVPEGDFVQCAAGSMPFRNNAFDVLLSLGVLHHLPTWQESLEEIIGLIRPSGLMLFDEAVEKPRILDRIRKQSLTAAIDSPHEGEVAFDALQGILQRNGRVVSYRMKTTPIRVVLVWGLGKLMERSLLLTKMILGMDQMFRKSMGSVLESMGPGEVLGVFEKDAFA